MIELKTWQRAAIIVGALAVTGGVGGSMLASCAATPTSVPIQSFQRAQNMDVVCLNVFKTNGEPQIPAIPLPQAACAPVPLDEVDGGGQLFQNHLYALVTQTASGEVALVDLTGEYVVDEDPGTPGTNFLPVGTLPTDIASTPDGVMSFVGSGNPNAPAIYALSSSIILGDSQGDRSGKAVLPSLTTWPACSLPQAPGALAVVPTSFVGVGDAGAPAVGSSGLGYVIVAVLPGDSADSAKIATIDPAPLLRGAGLDVDGGALIRPGSLDPCPVLRTIELAAPATTTTWTAGTPWDDGVKYVDGGVDAAVPTTVVASCVASDAGPAPLFPGAIRAPRAGAAALDTGSPNPVLYVADTQLPIIHAIDLTNPSAPVELEPLLATSIAAPSRAITLSKIAVSPSTRDFKRFLYAVDETEGDVMVYDVTSPKADPTSAEYVPHVPLTRPHPELDPFQPPDRLIFSAPVAALSFVAHDWPLQEELNSSGPVALRTALTGLLCNPNPLVDPAAGTTPAGFTADNGPFKDPGANYRNNVTVNPQPLLGPSRLRGVFAFATLTNGSVETIDVDDWDAPCRRPDPIAAHGSLVADGGGLASPPLYDLLLTGPFNAVAPPMQVGDDPTNAYNVPVAYQSYDTNSPVSDEWYFPVSAPHRLRSQYLLRNDPTNGNHAPLLSSPPQLFSSGAPIATQGDQAVQNPSLVPTDTTFVDPSLQANPTEPNPANRTSNVAPLINDAGVALSFTLPQTAPGATPGVRFAWEDPITQINQNWVVTYEGQLPGFYDNGGNPLIIADISTSADPKVAYQTLSLNSAGGLFCRKGIEDFSVATQRADVENAALAANGLRPIPSYDQEIGDYVQLTDNVLDPTDPYWTVDIPDCWTAAEGTSTKSGIPKATAAQVCAQDYGQTLDPANPNVARDYPILEAYDGSLVVGVFGYPPAAKAGDPAPPRQVIGANGQNVPYLRQMACCFHNQVHFNVRTGGQWSAVGSVSGFLHHVVATGSDNRCVPACDARDSLLNGRSAPVPRPLASGATATSACPSSFIPSIDRNSPLAMRNPMFSFLIWNGQNSTAGCVDVPPVRDMSWQFSTQGQVSPMAINLASTTTGLSPQSMKFIDSLGQLAIIDAESQGLILIDLGTFAEAHAPYF